MLGFAEYFLFLPKMINFAENFIFFAENFNFCRKFYFFPNILFYAQKKTNPILYFIFMP